MRQRSSGIDLIRCMGLLFVTGVHSFLYNGFYSEPQTGALIWAADSARWLFFTCNGIFMTLTGYLKCEKEPNIAYYRGLLPILVGYFLTCCITFPIRHFLIGEKLSLLQWVDKMVTFGNYAWYIEMYIGLFLLAPIINLAMKQLTRPGQMLWLLGTMIVVTALPSVTPLDIIPDYWTALYPLTYYVIGAFIRKQQPKLKPWLCLCMAGLFTAGLGLVSVLSTQKSFSDGFTQGYGGFWVVGIVFWLFLGLYRVQLKPRAAKVLAWMAGGCFEGYILSRLFDVWIYGTVPQWHMPAKYPLIFLCITLPVFAISVTAGKGVHTLAGWLCRDRKEEKSAVS